MSGSVTHHVALPRDDRAPTLAREFLQEHFGEELGGRALEDAKLVVSELATNAVVHGAGRIVLCARRLEDRLLLHVADDGSGGAPAIREQAGNEVGGWGLRIVEAISLRWGVHAGSTHVWAELPVG